MEVGDLSQAIHGTEGEGQRHKSVTLLGRIGEGEGQT